MKKYLLFSGSQYYPQPAMDDFVGLFPTEEDAVKAAKSLKDDWFQIVDKKSMKIVKQFFPED